MNKLLTIVIPCYNTEQYLAECLDSVLLPEYNDVLEVLAINDGSRDGTLALAREYEAKYPEILRVIDKPNGGWGTVINLAIKEACGRYFKILDSDDWFDKDAFAEFMAILKECEADILTSIYTEVYIDSSVIGAMYKADFCNRAWDMEEFAKVTNGNLNLPMTNITIRTQILIDNKIQMPPRYYGDIYYLLCATALAKSICVTNIDLYRYRKGHLVQSTSIDSYRRNCRDYISLIENLIRFYEGLSVSPVIHSVVKKNIIGLIKFCYKLLMAKDYCGDCEGSRELLADFNNFLKTCSKELYRASNWVTNKKVPFILIWRMFNINLYKLR